MKTIKCPKCKEHNDYVIVKNYDVECSYCGHVVGNVKINFKASNDKGDNNETKPSS